MECSSAHMLQICLFGASLMPSDVCRGNLWEMFSLNTWEETVKHVGRKCQLTFHFPGILKLLWRFALFSQEHLLFALLILTVNSVVACIASLTLVISVWV